MDGVSVRAFPLTLNVILKRKKNVTRPVLMQPLEEEEEEGEEDEEE